MMDTPVSDFARAYARGGTVRLHMPGHKGKGPGPEQLDITEIPGADELYADEAILGQSQRNAARLFGADRTLYSTEGSSLCIRAMAYLALLDAKENGRQPLILAGRNAHKAFLSAVGLTGVEVRWLYGGAEEGIAGCAISPEALARALEGVSPPPAAVYVTSPDYLGHIADIAGLSAVCRRAGVPLLVDNAHGAYLRFLPEDLHPLTLGADLCCDSAHKTLPVLTGGAYLHISDSAPKSFGQNARRAMALFASSSPSYLTLTSLDECNRTLSESFPAALAELCARLDAMKRRLADRGFELAGEEKTKLSIRAKSYGYTGDMLHAYLRLEGIECEFSDPDYLTAMFSPSSDARDMRKLEDALLALSPLPPIRVPPPPLPRPKRAMSVREALMAPAREMPLAAALGRVFVSGHASCPPCVSILAPGEVIDENALACFRYYEIGMGFVL